MILELNPIAPNQTEIVYDDGRTVFYSYKTPVVVFVSGRGALATKEKYSVTTVRHINQTIKRWGCSRTDVPQSEINELAGFVG